MSDVAFKTAKYPSYTTAELQTFIAKGEGNKAMEEEVSRRILVSAGVVAVMTSAERLRFIKG